MIEVVCGVIFNDQSEILIAQKKDGNYKGKWEFAGGKVHEDESPEESLIREIKEELDISITVISKIYESYYEHYKLLFYKSRYYEGDIVLKEHSDAKWIKIEDLSQFDLVDGDKCMLDIL